MSQLVGSIIQQGFTVQIIFIQYLLRKGKINSQTFELVRKVQSDVVLQVEQVSKLQNLSGKEKKEKQMVTQKEILSHYGVKVSDQWLSMMIEQQVFLMNLKIKDLVEEDESKKVENKNTEQTQDKQPILDNNQK